MQLLVSIDGHDAPPAQVTLPQGLRSTAAAQRALIVALQFPPTAVIQKLLYFDEAFAEWVLLPTHPNVSEILLREVDPMQPTLLPLCVEIYGCTRSYSLLRVQSSATLTTRVRVRVLGVRVVRHRLFFTRMCSRNSRQRAPRRV